ncbi:hypothetical protein Y032_0668g1353 [Ancylostoma ceylanicum]|uniref:Uncharacterized protein n=1 Tax=Ancylostoma ceylanicum TaxID=53326 RepID=A0A016WJN7_9BILA|nr:hypothetical protein Y032_0668g1353 [Ancylostoma ceylanicum]
MPLLDVLIVTTVAVNYHDVPVFLRVSATRALCLGADNQSGRAAGPPLVYSHLEFYVPTHRRRGAAEQKDL